MSKVLVVDDNEDIIHLMGIALQRHLQIRGALSGEEAIAKIQEEEPDIIFLDIQMPGMDGFQVLDWIQANNVNSKVIMVSAFGDVKNRDIARAKGAIDFLTKPLNINEIIDIVLQFAKHYTDMVEERMADDECVNTQED